MKRLLGSLVHTKNDWDWNYFSLFTCIRYFNKTVGVGGPSPHPPASCVRSQSCMPAEILYNNCPTTVVLYRV